MNYVGIDYHKRYSVVCVVDEAGAIKHEERIEHAWSERFGALLSAHAPCAVAFEATMNWGWLYDLLAEVAGVERIVMTNPYHVRLIAAAQVKTDKVDARKLAQLLRANLLPASHIPDAPTRRRKEVLRQRTFLGKRHTKPLLTGWHCRCRRRSLTTLTRQVDPSGPDRDTRQIELSAVAVARQGQTETLDKGSCCRPNCRHSFDRTGVVGI